MRQYFQTEWQGIRFSDFTTLSSKELAGSAFYQAFYEEFFKRYRHWEQLSPGWLRGKQRCAEFIVTRFNPGQKLLSVGCGLGAVEHFIKQQQPDADLCIHEVAPKAWRWIAGEFPEDKQRIGLIPECMPAHDRFDLVYLSAVDYALDQKELVALLAGIRPYLADQGQCLLLSASFEKEAVTLSDRMIFLLKRVKHAGLRALDTAGIRSCGQFWGWFRAAVDYREVMQAAGYALIQEGCIDPGDPASYWIAGRTGLSSSGPLAH